MGRILHGPSAVQSMLRVRSSAAHVRFQKLNFIVHVSLIVCVITFRVIVDILAWVSSVAAVVSHRFANRRTSATTNDVLVTISKTIEHLTSLSHVYLFICIFFVYRMQC